MERYKPIVTVQVIAYNSSETIISTLDSIKSQTYLEIELVVSDDNSSDNTLDLTRKWIKTNGLKKILFTCIFLKVQLQKTDRAQELRWQQHLFRFLQVRQ